jgi:hypothetical protein
MWAGVMPGRPKRQAAREAAGEVVERPVRSSFPVHERKRAEVESYAWEDFQRGNFIAVHHGGDSERVVGPLASELVGWLLEVAPDLAAPRFRFALSAWARCEARAALLGWWLDRRGVVDEDGEARERLLRELRAEERRAREERRVLGLDPSGYVRLVRERAEATLAGFDLEAAIVAGREVIDAAEVEAS